MAVSIEDLENQLSFTRVITPETFGIDPMVFMNGVALDAITAVQANALRKELRGKTPNSSFTRDENIGWLILNATEMEGIVVDPPSKANSVARLNMTQTPAMMGNRDHDERLATADRAGAHSLEDPLKVMETFMERYHEWLERLRSLRERIEHPNFRREKGSNFLLLAVDARNEFQGILQTLADARKWSASVLDDRRLAMDYLLFGRDGNKSEMLRYWMAMTELDYDYTRNKKYLFRSKALACRAIIDAALGDKEEIVK